MTEGLKAPEHPLVDGTAEELRAADPFATQKSDEREMHPASRRRDELRNLQRRFGNVAVKQGTEQSAAIVKLIDDFTTLAQTLEIKCADGRSKDLAMDHLLQAKMLAIHAVSHR